MKKPDLFCLIVDTRYDVVNYVGTYQQCVSLAVHTLEPRILENFSGFDPAYPVDGDNDDKLCWIQEIMCGQPENSVKIAEADNDLLQTPFNIADIVLPDEISQAYSNLIQDSFKLIALESDVEKVKREIQVQLGLLSDPESGVVWAKNEDGRTIQRYELTRELQAKKEAAEDLVTLMKAQIAADRLLIENFKVYIDYFQTRTIFDAKLEMFK